ncbi:MAG: DUF4340 domain-containing protein, partial [Verrucomicrobiales bacterium]
MGQKSLVRLLFVLAVLAGVAFILNLVNRTDSGGDSGGRTSERVLPDFALNEVAQVRIKTGSGELNIKAGDKGWTVAEREGFPADVTKVIGLIKKVWDLKPIQTQPGGSTLTERFSLVDPSKAADAPGKTATVLSFLSKDGKEVGALWLGKTYDRKENQPSPFGGGMSTTPVGRYVKAPGSEDICLVNETLSEVVTDPADWLNKDFVKVDKLKSISIKSGTASDDWKLTRDSAEGDLVLDAPKAGEDVDNLKTSPMKTAFSSVSFEDIVKADEIKDKPFKTTFAIETFEGFNYQFVVTDKNDLNELFLKVDVTGKFEEKRKPGEEETDEEKKKKDEEFAAELKRKQDKLAAENALEGRIFKVRSWNVENLIKKRSELMKSKEPAVPSPADGAPGGLPGGLQLPGVNAPVPAPKPAESAPKPSAEAPKPAAEAPKPAAEAPKPAAEAPKPAAEAPKPAAEAPKPAAEAPKPAAEAPKPAAEAPKPAAEAP